MTLFFTTTTGNGTVAVTADVWFKPVGRGRRFDRLARGLARRLRIPWVRSTLWERDHPESRCHATVYGTPWTSANALANYSFACACHKRPRYKRHKEN